MVEWLKELSLFDHFLLVLLKYLNDDTAKQKPFQGQHHTYIGTSFPLCICRVNWVFVELGIRRSLVVLLFN